MKYAVQRQLSIAIENQSIPLLHRNIGIAAYGEGWGLYAEQLADEMGMYADYQVGKLGMIQSFMYRSARLVTDTGMHAKGWSREQAIRYMLDNSGMSETEVVAEVERYIAIPGQALAYKIGQLTIRRLRDKAEKALGPRFDIRAFHAQVLDTGALPMTVLEAKIDDWIAATKATGKG